MSIWDQIRNEIPNVVGGVVLTATLLLVGSFTEWLIATYL